MEKQVEASISEMSHFFSTRVETIEYLLLQYLLKNLEPVGSWVLKVVLDEKNVAVSTATIGRILKDTDAKGYTRLVGAQGRVITEDGISYVEEQTNRLERERLQKNLIHAAQPENLQELLDVLHARKALECETSRLAAERADHAALAALKEHLECHEQCVTERADPSRAALDFHATLAKASGNKFLIAALDILFFEQWRLESQIHELITRKRGAGYAHQHRSIVEAIMQADADEAERLMKMHMQVVIDDVNQQIASESNQTVEADDKVSPLIIG
ncbi:FadR/GntR family transcriptional regulator [Paenibacillus daejeonensis]|uniref:FadR/GntR family transcriptional regulator n=1 Tax=Paenibacillus daejeonensis TaxID=135193 RepID=UPI00035F6D83|nr:FCD domain-containing protein [Paenibacillus daejeonensis]